MSKVAKSTVASYQECPVLGYRLLKGNFRCVKTCFVFGNRSDLHVDRSLGEEPVNCDRGLRN